MLPSFSLTGNSCPASSWRPCQHPPLEYFRGKSENDQQPPKRVFSHMPYMGILSRSGCYARVSSSWHPPKHIKYPTTGGILSAQLQPHTHPYPSAATLAHVSPVRLTLTLTHGFTAASQSPRPVPVFPKNTHDWPNRTHSPLLSSRTAARPHRTGMEEPHGIHNPRSVSCSTHRTFTRCSQLWAHGTQATSHPVNTLASFLHPHPHPLLLLLLKDLIKPVSSLLLARACWVHRILLKLNQSPPP